MEILSCTHIWFDLACDFVQVGDHSKWLSTAEILISRIQNTFVEIPRDESSTDLRKSFKEIFGVETSCW